jgi:hypothetical protein
MEMKIFCRKFQSEDGKLSERRKKISGVGNFYRKNIIGKTSASFYRKKLLNF